MWHVAVQQCSNRNAAINRNKHLSQFPVNHPSNTMNDQLKFVKKYFFLGKESDARTSHLPPLYNHLIDLKIKWKEYRVLPGARSIVCWSCILVGLLPGAAWRSDYFLSIYSGIRLFSHDLWDTGHRTNGVKERKYNGKRGTIVKGGHSWSSRRWCDFILSFTEHVWRGDHATSRLSNPLLRPLMPSKGFDALNPTSHMKTAAALNWFQQVT